MTNKQFTEWMRNKGLTTQAAADLLGLSLRQVYRYKANTCPVPPIVNKLITCRETLERLVMVQEN